MKWRSEEVTLWWFGAMVTHLEAPKCLGGYLWFLTCFFNLFIVSREDFRFFFHKIVSFSPSPIGRRRFVYCKFHLEVLGHRGVKSQIRVIRFNLCNSYFFPNTKSILQFFIFWELYFVSRLPTSVSGLFSLLYILFSWFLEGKGMTQ